MRDLTHPLLREACAQADNCITAALGCPPPGKSCLSSRGTVANPAPLALGLAGEALAAGLALSGSWFETVCCQGGYLNFSLSERWYRAAVSQPPPVRGTIAFPEEDVDFPAAIVPEDWWFWQALKGRRPSPALAARQDRANPGWLVRYTAQRLVKLVPRADRAAAWGERERKLMLELAGFSPEERPGKLARYLLGLAGTIWEGPPQRLSRELNQHCQAVLNAGRLALADSQKIHPK